MKRGKVALSHKICEQADITQLNIYSQAANVNVPAVKSSLCLFSSFFIANFWTDLSRPIAVAHCLRIGVTSAQKPCIFLKYV